MDLQTKDLEGVPEINTPDQHVEVETGISVIKPAQSVDSVVEMASQLQKFVAKALTENEDYGVIPGCGKKPTLLKPGAEKLSNFFGLGSKIIHVDKTENWDKESPFFAYDYHVAIFSIRNPNVILGDCIGHANSMEKKWAKRKQYGSKAERDATPSEIFSQVNTIKKIAEKRGYVGAVIKATRASHKFTQDLEDLKGNEIVGTPSDNAAPKQTPAPYNNKVGPDGIYTPAPYNNKVGPDGIYTDEWSSAYPPYKNVPLGKLTQDQILAWVDKVTGEGFRKKLLAYAEKRFNIAGDDPLAGKEQETPKEGVVVTPGQPSMFDECPPGQK
jgi:hypothetical protein